jgi:hypothetical protein
MCLDCRRQVIDGHSCQGKTKKRKCQSSDSKRNTSKNRPKEVQQGEPKKKKKRERKEKTQDKTANDDCSKQTENQVHHTANNMDKTTAEQQNSSQSPVQATPEKTEGDMKMEVLKNEYVTTKEITGKGCEPAPFASQLTHEAQGSIDNSQPCNQETANPTEVTKNPKTVMLSSKICELTISFIFLQ